MTTVNLFVLLCCPLAAVIGAQELGFEVASVRRNDRAVAGHGLRESENIQPSRRGLMMRHVSLRSSISWAYGIRPYQVSAPAWVGDSRFDIWAKAAVDVTVEQLRLMLRKLLAERFRLKVHRDRRDLAVHVLMLGQQGLRMRESDGARPGSVRAGRLGIVAESATMQQLAEALEAGVYGPVVDDTGLPVRSIFICNSYGDIRN